MYIKQSVYSFIYLYITVDNNEVPYVANCEDTMLTHTSSRTSYLAISTYALCDVPVIKIPNLYHKLPLLELKKHTF